MDQRAVAEILELFIEQHGRVRRALAEVHARGLDTDAGAACLAGLCRELLGHLEAEDKMLYEPLWHASGVSQEIARTSKTFFADLLELKALVVELQDRLADGQDVTAIFGRMSTSLESRLNAEETVLFPLFSSIRTF